MVGEGSGAGPSGSEWPRVLLHLGPEPFGTPIGYQELEARVVPGSAVAVVPEHAGDGGPRLGNETGLHERPEPLGEVGVGGQASAYPQVESHLAATFDAHERYVVDLVLRALLPATRYRCLVLPRQVRELPVAHVPALRVHQVRRGVDQLLGVDPGEGAADHHPRGVAAGLLGGQAYRLDALPDPGHVLDADPVELDILAVGDVGDVASEPLAGPGHGAELLGGELPAGDPDPHHEELVFQLVGLGGGRGPAGDAAGAACTAPTRLRRSVLSMDRKPPLAYFDSMRARTFSPSSSRLARSAGLRGSK